MSTDDNNQATEDTTDTGDTGEAQASQTDHETRVRELEAELSKRDETLGSLKRELKDLKKAKEEQPANPAPDANADLLQKTFLRAASITADDEVELALETAKKWGVSVDKLVDDEDFKEKLEKFRTKKSNAEATSNVKGNGAAKSATQTPEFYIARGTPPTANEVPDRKTRASIARAMIQSSKTGKTFYND